MPECSSVLICWSIPLDAEFTLVLILDLEAIEQTHRLLFFLHSSQLKLAELYRFMTFEPAHEKRDLMVFQFVVLQMLMRSPLFGLQTLFLCLKLPQGLYYMNANSKALARLCICNKYLLVLAHLLIFRQVFSGFQQLTPASQIYKGQNMKHPGSKIYNIKTNFLTTAFKKTTSCEKISFSQSICTDWSESTDIFSIIHWFSQW